MVVLQEANGLCAQQREDENWWYRLPPAYGRLLRGGLGMELGKGARWSSLLAKFFGAKWGYGRTARRFVKEKVDGLGTEVVLWEMCCGVQLGVCTKS